MLRKMAILLAQALVALLALVPGVGRLDAQISTASVEVQVTIRMDPLCRGSR
jgi:hypothetical protein